MIPPRAPSKDIQINLFRNLAEKTESSETVFSGALLHVQRDFARLPDGSTGIREWIKHPGASAVLPLFPDGDILLLKQFRYPVKQVFYEVPAGKLDQGETPDQTAVRELREEAGLTAGNLAYAGHYYPGIGYANEIIHFFLAWDLRDAPSNPDHDEFVQPIRMPFSEALEMIYSNEISDGKTALCLLKAQRVAQKLGLLP
jgi:ADP-ribose pyrophosphatase